MLTQKDGIRNVYFSSDDKYVILSGSSTSKNVAYDCIDFNKSDTKGIQAKRLTFDGKMVTYIAGADQRSYYSLEQIKSVYYYSASKNIVAGTQSGNLIFWKEEVESPIETIRVASSPCLLYTSPSPRD